MSASLTIKRPDDWHLHLRDGKMLAAVLPFTARSFGRALIMPNLSPPVTTVAEAEAYRARIIAATPLGADFTPLMTLYLVENTSPDEVVLAAKADWIKAVKLYPAGATTNSAQGVRDIDKIMGVLERMAEVGLPLAVHGEVVDDEVDIFDREKVFIDQVLDPIRQRIPSLKVIMEHITTFDAVSYVRESAPGLAATITVHHLVINRNAILAGGINPHYYCLPVAKREQHRAVLVEAALSGDSRFFLGTDSAPHADADKLSACGCAGIFSAPCAIECLAQVFDNGGALEKMEGFTSIHGAQFYGLPPSNQTITLTKGDVACSGLEPIKLDGDGVTVFDPRMPIYWRVET